MKRPRTSVISQPAPGGEYGVFFRAGKARGGGKLLDERPVAVNHHRNPGLLQHDLRDKNAVGISFSAPRKFTLLLPVPCEQTPSKQGFVLPVGVSMFESGHAAGIVTYAVLQGLGATQQKASRVRLADLALFVSFTY